MTDPSAILQLSVRKPDWTKAIQALVVSEDEKIRLMLEAVGVEIFAWLKSTTAKRQPPVRLKGRWTGPRPAHPGGWADVTSLLVNSYQKPTVTRVRGGWRLTLANTAEYAVYLEAKEGYFVLSGVLDPGGEFDKAMQEIIPRVAPGWKWRAQGRVTKGRPPAEGGA